VDVSVGGHEKPASKQGKGRENLFDKVAGTDVDDDMVWI